MSLHFPLVHTFKSEVKFNDEQHRLNRSKEWAKIGFSVNQYPNHLRSTQTKDLLENVVKTMGNRLGDLRQLDLQKLIKIIKNSL